MSAATNVRKAHFGALEADHFAKLAKNGDHGVTAVTVFDPAGILRTDNKLIPGGFFAVDNAYTFEVYQLLHTGELVMLSERPDVNQV